MTFAGSNILPPNATPLERALADMDWDRISALDVDVIRSITDPATCPLPLLPWLAWAFSVDVWDDTWDEATRRAVIAASPAVQRVKGTRFAIRTALEAVDVTSTIMEWWEYAPEHRHGTFDVIIWVTGLGAPITGPLLDQVRQIVLQAKRKSIAFKIVLAAEEVGTAYVGGIQQNVLSITIDHA